MASDGRETSYSHRQPFSFRARLTAAFIAVAVLPLIVFGALAAASSMATGHLFTQLLLLAIVAGAIAAVFVAYAVAAEFTRPLGQIAAAVERVAAGEAAPPVPVVGDDELARLAESHNRVAAAAVRRNGELSRLLEAVCQYSPEDGEAVLLMLARDDVRAIFGLIDSEIQLVDPAILPAEERVPGEPLPVRAEIRAGSDAFGVLRGHLPATRTWRRADQDVLELFASELGVALRNAQLFARIEQQNARLVELDTAKDEFLRGVSHNLQTPLTSIRAYADQLLAAADDETTSTRLGIIADQTDRLTRLVRQLLTVTRLEAGALHPAPDVIALGPRVRRTWEALALPESGLEVVDESGGWLVLVDPDQLDQILWALLDNAQKYGRGGGILATVGLDHASRCVRLTIADHGPGVAEADRERLFTRFTRGTGRPSGEGTGLGLYVSRGLARSMGGDLTLEPPAPGFGAAFTLTLPGENPEDDES